MAFCANFCNPKRSFLKLSHSVRKELEIEMAASLVRLSRLRLVEPVGKSAALA
jgi:hypothetical protein